MSPEYIELWKEKADLQAENIALRFKLAMPKVKKMNDLLKEVCDAVQELKINKERKTK
jgi:hypothetical protein